MFPGVSLPSSSRLGSMPKKDFRRAELGGRPASVGQYRWRSSRRHQGPRHLDPAGRLWASPGRGRRVEVGLSRLGRRADPGAAPQTALPLAARVRSSSRALRARDAATLYASGPVSDPERAHSSSVSCEHYPPRGGTVERSVGERFSTWGPLSAPRLYRSSPGVRLFPEADRRSSRAPRCQLHAELHQGRPRGAATGGRTGPGRAAIRPPAVIALYLSIKRVLGYQLRAEEAILRAFCKTVGDEPIATLEPRTVLIFLNDNGPVTAYWIKKYRVLSGLYRYALARGLAERVPLPPAIPKPTVPAFVPYIYSHEEIKRLFDAVPAACAGRVPIDEYVFKTLLLVLYGAGLRIGEDLALRRVDVESGRSLPARLRDKVFQEPLGTSGHRYNRGPDRVPGQTQCLLPLSRAGTVLLLA